MPARPKTDKPRARAISEIESQYLELMPVDQITNHYESMAAQPQTTVVMNTFTTYGACEEPII